MWRLEHFIKKRAGYADGWLEKAFLLLKNLVKWA
jgi:hypothetical protein